MKRLLSSVDTAPRVGNSIERLSPVATRMPLEMGNAVPTASPLRNDLRRGSTYVGKSYLGRSRRSTGAGRPAMFRIS